MNARPPHLGSRRPRGRGWRRWTHYPGPSVHVPTLVALVRAGRLAHLWIKKGARHRRVGVAIRVGDGPRVEGHAPVQQGLAERVCGRVWVRKGYVTERRGVHLVERDPRARRSHVVGPSPELHGERVAQVRRRTLPCSRYSRPSRVKNCSNRAGVTGSYNDTTYPLAPTMTSSKAVTPSNSRKACRATSSQPST